jgi:hypothetical protein
MYLHTEKHTNPVHMLPLVRSVGGSLQEQRCLAHSRGPIDFRHFSSCISTGDRLARQAGRGEKLVELRETGRYSARPSRTEALQGLGRGDGGQSMSCVAGARGRFVCHCARLRKLRASLVT